MSKLVAFRCPDELFQRLDEHATATNVDRSAVLIAALRHFLDGTPPMVSHRTAEESRTELRLDCVERAVSNILDRLDALERPGRTVALSVERGREPAKASRPRGKGKPGEK